MCIRDRFKGNQRSCCFYPVSYTHLDVYKRQEVKEDAAAAARGYLEFGDYSLAAHTAVRKLGKAFLAKEYTSQSGEPMTLVKCIDFYHSGQLDKLVKEFKGKQDD
ncbi:T6SS amidase immunity protein Tai4 family protein [Erwinia amylovora]